MKSFNGSKTRKPKINGSERIRIRNTWQIVVVFFLNTPIFAIYSSTILKSTRIPPIPPSWKQQAAWLAVRWLSWAWGAHPIWTPPLPKKVNTKCGRKLSRYRPQILANYQLDDNGQVPYTQLSYRYTLAGDFFFNCYRIPNKPIRPSDVWSKEVHNNDLPRCLHLD